MNRRRETALEKWRNETPATVRVIIGVAILGICAIPVAILVGLALVSWTG